MELLQNTQTARLVLAYLYNQDLESLAEEFCRKSPFLLEERHLLEIGDIPVRPFSRSLVQVFSEYNRMCMQLLTLIGQYEEKLSFPESLSDLDKMDIILNHNRGDSSSWRLQNVTNLCKQPNKAPVIVAYTSQVVKSAATTPAVAINSESSVRRANDDGPHAVTGGTLDTSADTDNVPMATINLCRDNLLQLLLCEQDKENDGAIAYLLQQDTALEDNVSVNEPSNNRQMNEKVTVPQDGMTTSQLPHPQPKHLAPTKPSGVVTADGENQLQHEKSVASTCQPLPTSAEAAQTGMKEIVAAHILGSMAKAGFRSGTKNDTPPGNPIVKDISGGTRSTSSRKRSHIRILDFGTPASKRSSSVPGSADHPGVCGVEAGPHSRQLFAGQGTPASVDGNVPERPSPARFAVPATPELTKVVPGQAPNKLARNSPRLQQVSPSFVVHQMDRKNVPHSHMKSNTDLSVRTSSVSSVVTASDLSTQITDSGEKEGVPPSEPLDTQLHPVAEAQPKTDRSCVTVDATVESKPWPRLRVIATPDRKPSTAEQTHSYLSLASSIGNERQSFSQSNPKNKEEIILNKSEVNKEKAAPDPEHLSPRKTRITTRSATKKAIEDGVCVSLSVTKASKLPTKDSILKLAPVTTGSFGRSSNSATTTLVTAEALALHNAHPETPYKFNPLVDYPMTPRFLTDPFLSVSKMDASTTSVVAHREHSFAGGSGRTVALSETADINTPAYPITPGALGTPQSQTSPQSNAVCYYRPDEGDAIQPPNETLPADCTVQKHQDQASPAESANEDCHKMEVVSGGLVFAISSTPLLELYHQEPTTSL